MNLAGKRVVVAGGTGAVGEGIVRSLLGRNASVVVPVRSQQRYDELTEYVKDIGTGSLTALPGGFASPTEASALSKSIKKEFGQIDVAIASIGGWTQGPSITEVPFSQWEAVLRDNLTAHFLAMQALAPLIWDGGVYAHINGLSADTPFSGAGPVSAMAAAQKSLAISLAAELRPFGRKVYELILPPINTRTRVAVSGAHPKFPTAEQVGDYLASLIEQDAEAGVHYLNYN